MQRYPLREIPQKKQEAEYEVFDLERNRFFQKKAKYILKSILMNQSRKEKVTIITAFYKFCLNASFRPKLENIHEFTGSLSGFSKNPRSSSQKKALRGSQSRLSSQVQIQSSPPRATGKPPQDLRQKPQNWDSSQRKSRSPQKSMLFENEEYEEIPKYSVEKYSNVARMLLGCVLLVQSKNNWQKDVWEISVGGCFWKWFNRANLKKMEGTKSEIIGINLILNERIFREKMFRTKLRLQSADTDHKLKGLGRLLSDLFE